MCHSRFPKSWVSQTRFECLYERQVGNIWESEKGEYDRVDLPKLQSIRLQDNTFEGCNDDDQKTMEDEPYGYQNTLTMKSESEYAE